MYETFTGIGSTVEEAIKEATHKLNTHTIPIASVEHISDFHYEAVAGMRFCRIYTVKLKGFINNGNQSTKR